MRGCPRRTVFNHILCKTEYEAVQVMSLLALPCSAFREFYYKDIKTRTRELAGPPPASDYQGHQFVEIRLSLGELSLPNIGVKQGITLFDLVYQFP